MTQSRTALAVIAALILFAGSGRAGEESGPSDHSAVPRLFTLWDAFRNAGVVTEDRPAEPAGDGADRTTTVSPAAPDGPAFSPRTKYTLYIGLNDKTTRAPVMPRAEAKALLNAVCLKYVDGFTVSEAQGHWLDEANRPVREDSLVYVLIGPDEERVAAMLDEILVIMNQESILVEKDEVPVSFYKGKNP